MELAGPRTNPTEVGGLGLRIWFCNLLGLIYLSIDLLLVALILGGLFFDRLVPPSGAVREGNASPNWHLRELEASRMGSAEGFGPPS